MYMFLFFFLLNCVHLRSTLIKKTAVERSSKLLMREIFNKLTRELEHLIYSFTLQTTLTFKTLPGTLTSLILLLIYQHLTFLRIYNNIF